MIYWLIGEIRERLTEKVKLPVKVICVGNVTVGGTGKTLLVSWLANSLRARNINFLIVTKGYKSSLRGAKLVTETDIAEEVGDESVLLRNYGTVIACRRPLFVREFLEKLKPQVVIFDDGLQNPSFYKDVTIITIDANRGFGNSMLLPAGPLRELPYKALAKADAIISIGEGEGLDLKNSKKLFTGKITSAANLDKEKKYMAFSGIGNQEKFFTTLRQLGVNLVATMQFPDHHQYEEKELVDLVEQSEALGAILVTTEKDFVKLPRGYPAIMLKVELYIENKDKEKLEKIIYEKIQISN